VTGSERGRVRVWDAASGRLITSFKDGNLAVTRLSFSPDGKVLVTADAEALRIYREERFAPVGTLLGWARERVSRELTKAEREEYLH
jgi:WD40 repeat protein